MIGTPLLAALVWPALFAGGAAAVGAPIIIHLLARRRFKRIRWAAIEFLLKAERRNRRRVLLEELILLFLRCLAVLLIALLVARPYFRPEGLAALMKGADRTERIFVLDDSFSMGYRSGDETSFDRARRAVKRLIRLLREQSPNDTITVLRTSAMESPLATGVFLDESQTNELIERVEGLTVSQYGLSSRDCIESIRKLLDDQPDLVSATVYLVSDFQRKDWVDTGGSAAAGGLKREVGSMPSPIAPLATWRDEDHGLELILVDVGDDSAENAAVVGLETGPGQLVAGVSGSVTAVVSNFSQAMIDALDLELTVGTSVQPTVSIGQLPPGETVQVSMDVTVPRALWEQVRVSVSGDALPLDDERTLAIEAAEAIRILIVNGEPSSDLFRDEVALLRTALRPVGRIYSGNEVEVIDETELEEMTLDRYHLVMLANVYRVSPPAVESLTRYVFDGGGLAIFLGDQVDAEAYNSTLYVDGRGLLPARLLERVPAGDGGARLVIDDASHPMVRVFAGARNAFLAELRFGQYMSCAVVEAGTDETGDPPNSPLTKGGVRGVAGGNAATVVAHFTDGDRSPAIVERAYGRGRVTLMTTTCDQEWNNWAKSPSYVVSMLELVRHLGRGRSSSAGVLVGSPIEFSIDPQVYDLDVLVRTPGYPAEQEVAVTATPAETGRGFRVVWERTPAVGVYRFVLVNRSGEHETRMVAVNPDPTESDLSPAMEPDLREALHEMPFEYVAGLDALDRAGEESRTELWQVVLLAAMAVLMSEQLLGWWFGRRS
ncbi:MAG: BatA domain-containing protein [Planctomycetes bacterium]|nr:BatA domain-containing protein [Planctomycetota bacterium]